MEYADSKNLVVIITVHDGWTKTRFGGHPFSIANGGWLAEKSDYVRLARYGEELPSEFDSASSPAQKHQYALERFCDRLVQATGDQSNVIYEIFNEGEWYNRSRWSDFQRHFLKFFRSRTRQPLMVNDDHLAGSEFRSEPLTDIVALHTPQWQSQSAAKTLFDHHQRHFAAEPVKPFLVQ